MDGVSSVHRVARLGLTLVAIGLSACSVPPPSASPAPLATPLATAPTATPAPAVALNVRFAGEIGCAMFPYGCTATLSVLEPGADIADDWRPAPSDPSWAPAYMGMSAEQFEPAPIGRPPAVTPGPHRLVMSLLGAYDVASYAPDGSRAFDLLGRCAVDVEVAPDADGLDVLVTFTRDPASFDASCTMAAGGG